jgi:hypothetical protein
VVVHSEIKWRRPSLAGKVLGSPGQILDPCFSLPRPIDLRVGSWGTQSPLGILLNLFVDDAKKCMYNFASLAMESNEEVSVE